MSDWIYYSLWFLWVLWALDELRVSYAVHTDKTGVFHRTAVGNVSLFAFNIFTAFWFGWVIFG